MQWNMEVKFKNIYFRNNISRVLAGASVVTSPAPPLKLSLSCDVVKHTKNI